MNVYAKGMPKKCFGCKTCTTAKSRLAFSAE